MNTILKIIEKKGGMEALKAAGHFEIERKGYMTLNIDYIGKGPNGHDAIAVAHNYIQNGDVMADPDMQMEVAPGVRGLKIETTLYPYTFQNDSMGLFQRVYECDENGKPVGVRTGLKKQLNAFLRTWGANLRAQGFLKAAAS